MSNKASMIELRRSIVASTSLGVQELSRSQSAEIVTPVRQVARPGHHLPRAFRGLAYRRDRCMLYPARGVAIMMDAFFWYTGVVAWILIVLAGGLLLAADAHDRSVQRRTGNS
jgi:hypothetical protein